MEILFNMKVLLIFGLFIIVVQARENTLMLTIIRFCSVEEKIDLNQISNIYDVITEREGPPSQNLKCFIACCMGKGGFFNRNNGEFNFEKMKELVNLTIKTIKDKNPADKIIQNAERCIKSTRSTERCERAWQFARCVTPH